MMDIDSNTQLQSLQSTRRDIGSDFDDAAILELSFALQYVCGCVHLPMRRRARKWFEPLSVYVVLTGSAGGSVEKMSTMTRKM